MLFYLPFSLSLQSYENLMSSDAESSAGEPRSSGGGGGETTETGSSVLDTSLKEPEVLTPQQIDEQLHRHDQGKEEEGRVKEGKGGRGKERGREGERTAPDLP